MEIQTLIPLPDAIPAAGWLFRILLLITFLLHILLMNLMLGGSLLTLHARLKRRPVQPESRTIPTLIALTINLGVPPLLFLQVLYGHLFYTSSVLMAVFWLAVIPLLILAYYAAYASTGNRTRVSPWTTLWMAISTVLLLAIGFAFTNNMTLMVQPERWTAYFQHPGGTLLNLGDPTLIPRYLHFVVAAVAVAGLGSALTVRFRRTDPMDRDAAAANRGLRIFAWATLLQMAVGIWFWLSLPRRILLLFLGGSPVATGHLALGILLAIAATILAYRGRVWGVFWTTLLLLAVMIAVRDMVRLAYLEPYFQPSQLQVRTEWTPLIGFLAAAVAAVAFLIYALRHAWRATQPGSEGRRGRDA